MKSRLILRRRHATCYDDKHHRGKKTHVHCSDQLCCWGPEGKREPCLIVLPLLAGGEETG